MAGLALAPLRSWRRDLPAFSLVASCAASAEPRYVWRLKHRHGFSGCNPTGESTETRWIGSDAASSGLRSHDVKTSQ